MMKQVLKKAANFFRKISSKKVIEPVTPIIDAKPAEKRTPDLIFMVKKINDQLFEVNSKGFPGIKGRGTHPEQALLDLLQNLNKQIDEMVRTTLVTTLHKEEIQKKYKKLVEEFYATQAKKNKSWLQKIKNWINPKQPSSQLLEVNISLKKPTTTDHLLDKFFRAQHPQMNLAKLPYPPMDKRMMIHPLMAEEDNRIFLKTDTGEFPINMLMDQEGNNLDETFSFGIVVNLN